MLVILDKTARRARQCGGGRRRPCGRDLNPSLGHVAPATRAPGERTHAVGGVSDAAALFEEGRRWRVLHSIRQADKPVVDTFAEARRPAARHRTGGCAHRHMSIAELARRLPDRLRCHHRQPRRRAPPTVAVRGDAWSNELLDDRVAAGLRALSPSSRRLRPSRAEAIVGDNAAALVGRLVGASLRAYQDGRYSMLESIRAYATDRSLVRPQRAV